METKLLIRKKLQSLIFTILGEENLKNKRYICYTYYKIIYILYNVMC